MAFCLITALATMSMSASAQQVWSLKRCLEHAYQNNLQLKQQQLNEKMAEASLERSYAGTLPVVNAFARQGFNFGRALDPFTNEFTNERVGFQDLYLNAEVTLFSGFQKVNQIRYQVHHLTATRFDNEKYKNDLTLTIAGAYLQILYNEEILAVAQNQVEISRQQLERTQRLLEAGTLAKGALLEIEAQLANEELNVVKAQNNLRLSYLELVHLLDLDPSEAFNIEKPEISILGNESLLDANEVARRALQNEPSVLAAQERILAAEKDLNISKALRYPSLSLYGTLLTGYSQSRKTFTAQPTNDVSVIGYTLNGNEPVVVPVMDYSYTKIPYGEQISDNFRQGVGVSLRIPIFNGYDYRTQIQRSKVNLDNAQIEHQIKRNTLSKTIEQAYADALSALQKYQATQKTVEALDESFNHTRQRFDLGMVNSLEFNDSKNKLTKAGSELIQAKYDFVFRVKILEFYAGGEISL